MAINHLVAALCTVFVLSGQYRLATAQVIDDDSQTKTEQAIDACIANATNVEDGCNATDYAGSSNCSIDEYRDDYPNACYVGFICFTDGNRSAGRADLLGSCAAACYNLHTSDPDLEYDNRNCSEPASTLAPDTTQSSTQLATTMPIDREAFEFKIKLDNGTQIPAATMESWDTSEVRSTLAAFFYEAPYHVQNSCFYNVTIDAMLAKVTIELEPTPEDCVNNFTVGNYTEFIQPGRVINFTISGESFRANWWDPYSTTTTPAPIQSSTAAPTAAPMTPTAAPMTPAPTTSPTSAPAKSPTSSPTSPTVAPTPSPSSVPTPQPTPSPAMGPAFRLELSRAGGWTYSPCDYSTHHTAAFKANIRQAVLNGTTLTMSQLSEDGVTIPACGPRRARRSTGDLITAMVQLTAAVTADTARAALDELTSSGITGSAVFLDYDDTSLTLTRLGLSSGGNPAEMHASATRGPSPAPTAAVLVNTLTYSPTVSPADSSLDLSQATEADDSNDDGMIALGVILVLVFVGLLVATVWVLRNYKLPGRLAKAEPLSEAKEELLAGDTSANDADPYRMATMSDPLQSSTDPYRMATGSDPLQANTRVIQQTSIDAAAADLMAMEAPATSGDTYASQVQLRKDHSGAATTADRMSNFGALELEAAAPGAPPVDGGYIQSSPLPASMTLGGVTAGESKMDGMSLGNTAGQDVTLDALQLSNSASGETNLDSMRIDQIKSRLSPQREAAASGIPMDTVERFVEHEGALNRTGDNRTSQC